MTVQDTIAALGLTIEATFVPFSQSRNAKPVKQMSDRSMNWRVRLVKDGRTILETDYSAGIAHCLTYNRNGSRQTLAFAEAIANECETGWKHSESSGMRLRRHPGPDAADVLYSLVMDASVLDSRSFEEWAADFGFDPDSRKAEAMYRACLGIALALRNGIGEAGLAQLQEAFQNY
jgi:hypothetical protein